MIMTSKYYSIFLIILTILLKVKFNKSYTTHYNVKTILRYADNHEDTFLWPSNQTAWDRDWKNKIGIVSVDTCPFVKSVLIPKENIFYCVLPYNDLDQFGRKANAYQIPWATSSDPDEYSILKNRWIKVTHKDAMAFCQYEDVGPQYDDDFSYVFGTSHSLPESQYGGLAISPEVAQFLGIYQRFKPVEKIEEDDDNSSMFPNSFYSFRYNDATMSPTINTTTNTSSSSSSSSSLNSQTKSNENNDIGPTIEIPKYDPQTVLDFEGSTLTVFSTTSTLKKDDNDVRCTWQFMDDKDVPDGPWKKIVTTSQSDRILKSFIRHNEKDIVGDALDKPSSTSS
ncbi:hypothetical protein RB653_007898 [Dictyostelium firmibasis]|uniref:Uncharacterized protein n=1 Tax=Dictyostelium firmibasis TaxID=79012 RepID=A0AAN7YME1_9MYCE